MSSNNYTAFNAMVDIFAAPGKALDEVKPHVAWLWWPLAISILLAVASSVAYNLWVDFDWLIEETIRQLPPGTDAATAEGVRNFMKPGTTLLFSTVGVVLITLLIYLIQSTYLHLANKVVTGAAITFGQWFSFSAWTAFVGIINAIIVFAVIAMADSNQLPQHELLPLSMNQLFIHAAPGSPWFSWGNALTLPNLWTLVLMAIGYARWTQTPMFKAAIIATLPWVAIFGIWAAMI